MSESSAGMASPIGRSSQSPTEKGVLSSKPTSGEVWEVYEDVPNYICVCVWCHLASAFGLKKVTRRVGG